MKTQINHTSIKNRLIKAGFYQPVQGKFGCWVNENSVICYYAANNENPNSYALCYGDNRYYFQDVDKLNKLIGVVSQKINAKNNEIIHKYLAKDVRDERSV